MAPYKVIVNRKEFEAVRMSHADSFCAVEKATDTDQPWKYRLIFADTDSIIKAYRSLKDREPLHEHCSTPYRAVCRRLSILLLAADREEVHADGK